MCYYCHQVSYTTEAWNKVIQNADDRFEDIRRPIENLGGRFRAAFFTTGNFDVLAITEFPETVTPAEIAVAFAGGGAIATIFTTPLLSASQVVDARRKEEKPDYSSKRRKLAMAMAAVAGS